jgi:hypothetical protein
MMEREFAAYRNGDMRLNCAARTYIVPKATLKRRIDGTNINAVGHKQLLGRTADLLKKLKII